MPTRGELQQVLDRYARAYRSGDAEACAAVFLPNARMMSPYGPTAMGRAEIESLHAQWAGSESHSKRLEIVEWGGATDVAWALARFSEGSETGEGTSLNIFERQPDGTWLIRLSALNAADPAG